MADVFISYSRKDTEFVRKLVDSLKADGLDVWVDFEDIPFATDWWKEIVSGIEAAQSTIFVLSPDSLQSKVCSLEVNYIINNKKRLIPILIREQEVNALDTTQYTVPKAIRNLNWIFFHNEKIYDESYKKLRDTMNTNFESVRDHTRLLLKAREWENSGRNTSFLLRGAELQDYMNMLERKDLTTTQLEFLRLSESTDHFNQMVQRFGWGLFAGVLGMGFYVLVSFSSSNILRDPTPLALALSAGQVFGLFVGGMGLLSFGLPKFISNRIQKEIGYVLRLSLTVVFGILAWMVYQWFFLHLGLQITTASIMGGLGLSFAYVLTMVRPVPVWVSFLVAVITTFIPIWLFNGTQPIIQNVEPLLYFRSNEQIFTVGIPMAILLSLGTSRGGLANWVSDNILKFGSRKIKQKEEAATTS
jgi:hypothetical protein